MHSSVVLVEDLAQIFGIELSRRAVEPTRSTNMTVSWRRSADGVGWPTPSVGGHTRAVKSSLPVSGSPQSPQNCAPGALAFPQAEHVGGIAAPHLMQYLLPPGTSALQLGHSTAGPLRSGRTCS